MALFGNRKKTATPESKKTVSKKNTNTAQAMQDLYTTDSKEAKAKTTRDQHKHGEAHRILVKPLVTEKAAHLNASNKYVFVVSVIANKISVARAIEDVYGVKPVKVNLINIIGKQVTRGRIRGQRNDWRKAIVTLPAGKTIKIYEGV